MCVCVYACECIICVIGVNVHRDHAFPFLLLLLFYLHVIFYPVLILLISSLISSFYVTSSIPKGTQRGHVHRTGRIEKIFIRKRIVRFIYSIFYRLILVCFVFHRICRNPLPPNAHSLHLTFSNAENWRICNYWCCKRMKRKRCF